MLVQPHGSNLDSSGRFRRDEREKRKNTVTFAFLSSPRPPLLSLLHHLYPPLRL